MDKLTKKTMKVSRGYTYTYYTSPAKEDKCTVLLVHGWPDSAAQWSHFANEHLIPEGYGVVAIDCLGYAGTSKPTDYNVYNFKDMTKDVVDILDAEKLEKVISLGHDWGCGLSQRVYNFYPERCLGLVFVNVSYIVPGEPFDLDAAIKGTEQIFGDGICWYWKLFAGDDGPDILNAHMESLWTIVHGA
jgi:soluble epoxide hydrolase / lipid-phosphate phosphatase